ncbi:DUF2508 family protein [Paenibacillus donghaensis]|uniref:DUF2508 domain-containing protein n=1 Tax=Paenibacillus donghaensis TaxID=414771 RepID=A0A2Z2KGV8_9BACL|nr:DUF2508 family protein [Paenibacillus donghaensis]ASA25097.1 hypothetical protein B9T62_32725 [Paenibacillus donghaensis]
MNWWNLWRRVSEPKDTVPLEDDGWNTLLEVRKAQSEWERAYLMFDEALGQDQIDYAIYILEAAERKYQIHLKHAKRLGLNSSRM